VRQRHRAALCRQRALVLRGMSWRRRAPATAREAHAMLAAVDLVLQLAERGLGCMGAQHTTQGSPPLSRAGHHDTRYVGQTG
jgi:hypothetical protein